MNYTSANTPKNPAPSLTSFATHAQNLRRRKMIRFIDLSNQITGDIHDADEDYDDRRFAFYNTVYDKFCEFNGSQDWDRIDDFIRDFENDKKNLYSNDLDRFLSLIPKDFFEPNHKIHQLP